MKRFRIKLSVDAYEDIEETLRWLAERSDDAPYRWYSSVMKAIRSLEQQPMRCGLAREDQYFTEELRQLVVGNYRIIFVIGKDTVNVTRIRHTARLPYRKDD